MEIEFLYFEGCPNHEPALQLLKKVMGEEGISAPVKETDVVSDSMAQEVRFAGSPSIRVNNQDIEAEGIAEQGYGRKCRIYSVDGAPKGVPPESLIRDAFTQAKTKGSCCE
jgi:Domain of unknown function (DUF2703)